MSFYQIMQKLNLADQPIWTISTDQKAPVAPKPALKNNFNPDTFHQWFQLCSDPEHDLVSLTDLYNNEHTPLNRIALHVDIDRQHIMLIDIEKEYDHNLIPLLKHLPAIYGEQSVHGGLHYIVPIPDRILNDLKYQNLFIRSQIKFGKVKQPHSGIEMFFHNHYLTFTQNQINTQNQNTDEDLKKVLDYIIKNEAAHQQVINQNYIQNETAIPTDALVIADHALSDSDIRKVKYAIEHDDPSDKSSYEYKIIGYLAFLLNRSRNNGFALQPILKDELLDSNATHDPKMLTWALLTLAKQYLPPRDKWQKPISNQSNQNYLEWTCNKVMSNLLKK